MNGLCEFTVGRRYPRNWRLGDPCEKLPCEHPASWRFIRNADGRSAEFCTDHAEQGPHNCHVPNPVGRWERMEADGPAWEVTVYAHDLAATDDDGFFISTMEITAPDEATANERGEKAVRARVRSAHIEFERTECKPAASHPKES